MNADRARAEYATLAAAVATIVGSVGPWYRAGDVTAALLDGDAIFTIVFGVLCAWIVFAEDWHRRAAIVVAAFGVLVLVVAGYALLDIQSAVGNQPTLWLWLTIAGGLGLVSAGTLGTADLREDGDGSGGDD